MSFEFMDPTGSTSVAVSRPAARLDSIRGKRLALLDNGKTNAAKFLTMVGQLLGGEYGVGDVRMFHKAALSKPCPRETIEEIAAYAEFVVTGIGDCGSCSTNSVHDAIELEKMGIPSVAVCTEAFLPGLDTLAKMRGMPDYRFAVVPHPLGVLFDDELMERAKLAAPQVAAIAAGEKVPLAANAAAAE